jgi:hypothetical protein
MKDVESTRYSQRALFFALLVSCLQPAISQCSPGTTDYDPIYDMCTMCATGKYKTLSDNSACIDCPANSYGPGGSQTSTCTPCATSTQSLVASKTKSSCICIPGWTGLNDGPCTACVAGKYKNETGDKVCSNCDAGKYSTTVGASICSDCGAGKYSK